MTLIAGSIQSGDVTYEYVAGKPVRYTRDATGLFFHADTPADVRRIIRQHVHSGKRLRLFYGDPTTGRDWLSEFETFGTIGASTGSLRVPLLIDRSQSYGAPISGDNVLRIQHDGRDLYTHPLYHLPLLTVRPVDSATRAAFATDKHTRDLTHEVLAGATVHARFKSEARALRWCEYMRGERGRSW
jgi:hypothetical protein